MALIRRFEPSSIQRPTLHDEIEGKIGVFKLEGRVLVQIDSFGRDSREIPGKKSQTIQLDREGAEQLYNTLKEAFNFK